MLDFIQLVISCLLGLTDFSATNFYSRILDNLVVEEVLETDFEVPKKTKKKHFHSGEGLLNFFAIS